MASKADSNLFVAEERSGIFREIIGILFGLLGLLLMLALISISNGSHWTGRLGEWVAESLFFIFGQYIAYLVPVMLGLCALNALRGELYFSTRGTSWRRGLGGLLVIISACALLTLSVPVDMLGHDIYAFARGGLIGNFLIHSKDLNIGAMMGHVGSIVVFSGLALIGVVMFTEKLVRDLLSLIWMGMARLTGLRRRLAWLQALRLRIPGLGVFKAVWRAVWFPFAWLGSLSLLAKICDWMGGVSFSAPTGAEVKWGAKKSIEGVSGRRESTAPDDDDEDYYGPREEDEESETDDAPPLPRPTRGGMVFPQRGVLARGAAVRPLDPRVGPVPAWDDDPEPSGAMEAADGRVEVPETAPLPVSRRERRRRGLGLGGAAPVQDEMELFPAEYQLPGLELLTDPPATMYEMSDEEKDRLSRKIEQTLAQFKVEVEVIEVIQGPVITRFALRVAPGVRVNRILALESELAMALRASHVRILAPIPGQSAVGIELPNKRANPVMLKDLLDSDAYRVHKSLLSFALGKNIAGEPVICDLAQMPHLLIAGTTGSGKSVCLNAIIASLLYRNKPDRVKFVMIDPKRVELSIYQAIPHLIAPVVSETKKAAAALAWCVEQMEERYKLLAEIGGVRNVDAYNALLTEKVPSKKIMGRGDLKFLPHIVIIIDELADLMMVARNEVEEYIIRLAQMARAVGMHLVLATQRPSVNVITGIIKANFPSRIAFQVSSKVDSRTILDMNGAEALMGRGDMLYSPGGAKPFRIQGCFVSDGEVERLADYIREQEKARYEKEDFEARPTPAERAKAQLKLDEDGCGEPGAEIEAAGDRVSLYLDGMAATGRAGLAPLTPADMELLSDEDLYEMALKLVLESRKASVSYIQRRMKIGYARAGRIMDLMEERGIVGPYQGSKPRDLLVDPEEFMARKNEEKDA